MKIRKENPPCICGSYDHKNGACLDSCSHGVIEKTCTQCHTEDCLDANDDTSVLNGKCVCPKPQHTPTSWIKTVMHEATRTPQEVAVFAGPNASYVLRAVNSHEELLNTLKWIKKIGMDENIMQAVDKALAKAEGK